MGTGYNFDQLQAEILKLSNSTDWTHAKLEWNLHSVVRVSEEQICLCGHHPIFQVCTLKNTVNNNFTDVGNVCVERFLGMRSKRIFSALKRVRSDINKNLNKETLEIFCNLKVIGIQDVEEYLGYYRKRKNITDDQKDHRAKINQEIIDYADRNARASEERFRKYGLRKG